LNRVRANALTHTPADSLANTLANTRYRQQHNARNEPRFPGSVNTLLKSTIVRSAWPVLAIFLSIIV
jgi:hypothetical protein